MCMPIFLMEFWVNLWNNEVKDTLDNDGCAMKELHVEGVPRGGTM